MLLDFKNPVFHKGVNLTVRNGLKWYDAYANGEREVVLGNNGSPVGAGVIVDCTVVPFGDIDPRWLYSEHDHECRTREGLKKVMQKTYGAKFAPNNVVTLVWFREVTTYGKV